MTDTDMHGGHARFEALYERHREPVMRYALRRVGPDHAADVVAETFLVALRKPDNVPTDNELPWLYAVARNHIRNHRRTEQKWFSLDATAAQSGDNTTDVAARLDLRSAFARLDFDDAEVLRLIAWEGLAPREAATVFGRGPRLERRPTDCERLLGSGRRTDGSEVEIERSPVGGRRNRGPLRCTRSSSLRSRGKQRDRWSRHQTVGRRTNRRRSGVASRKTRPIVTANSAR